MGHNDRERRRLALQAAILAPLTQEHLTRAGLMRGMSVVDLGCGVGDVTLLAAEMVGPEGHVTGVDMDPDALDVAAGRAREQGLENVSFVRSAVDAFTPDGAPHAVIGRHILIHTQDPLAVLRQAHAMLPSGGIAAFQEFDFAHIPRADQPLPLTAQAASIFTELFGRMGRAHMGTKLRGLFVEAGFEAPRARGEFGLDGGPESPYCEWLAESVRSVLPRAQALGIGVELAPIIDELAERLREETLSANSVFTSPIMVGCYARKS